MMFMTALSVSACNGSENDINKDNDSDNKLPIEQAKEIDIFEYEEVYFIDWIDDKHLLAIKENDRLDKLSLAELSEKYPQSIYSYDVEADTYELILEQENANLGEAALSPDRSFMLYSVSTLGDPSFNVYDMKSKSRFSLSGDPIGGAISAKWVLGEKIIGAAYSGGVYIADVTGDIRLIEEVTDEMVYLVEKVGDTLLYNTNSNPNLMSYNVQTRERKSLEFESVQNILRSPVGDQLLIVNSTGTSMVLYKYDLNNSIQTKLAEGLSIEGISWAPSGEKIAYILTSKEETMSDGTLYIHNLMTNQTEQITDGIQYGTTLWDLKGERLVFTLWDGENRNSRIVNF